MNKAVLLVPYNWCNPLVKNCYLWNLFQDINIICDHISQDKSLFLHFYLKSFPKISYIGQSRHLQLVFRVSHFFDHKAYVCLAEAISILWHDKPTVSVRTGIRLALASPCKRKPCIEQFVSISYIFSYTMFINYSNTHIHTHAYNTHTQKNV